MTARDENGIPILGAVDPEQERRKFVDALMAEKAALAEDDHDWIVLIGYSLTEHDAERAAIAKVTGIPASPAIPVTHEAMRNDVGPLCAKCNQMFVDCQAMPCPGMSFEDYLASLDDATRDEVLAKMQAEHDAQQAMQASPLSEPAEA